MNLRDTTSTSNSLRATVNELVTNNLRTLSVACLLRTCCQQPLACRDPTCGELCCERAYVATRSPREPCANQPRTCCATTGGFRDGPDPHAWVPTRVPGFNGLVAPQPMNLGGFWVLAWRFACASRLAPVPSRHRHGSHTPTNTSPRKPPNPKPRNPTVASPPHFDHRVQRAWFHRILT